MATLELPDENILIARFVISLVLLIMYSYNFMRAYRSWHAGRDWDTFRQFLMAFELEFGVLLIFLSYVNTAFFAQNGGVTDAIRTMSLVLLGVLIVGGATLLLSWRKPREQWTDFADKGDRP